MQGAGATLYLQCAGFSLWWLLLLVVAEGSGAGGVQTAKASRKQSSLSGKESAQGCIPNALEKEMATHSSVLAWRIPGTEKPGGLQSMGSHRAWTCPRGHSAGKQPAELTPGRPAMAGFNMASGELGPRLAFLGGG